MGYCGNSTPKKEWLGNCAFRASSSIHVMRCGPAGLPPVSLLTASFTWSWAFWTSSGGFLSPAWPAAAAPASRAAPTVAANIVRVNMVETSSVKRTGSSPLVEDLLPDAVDGAPQLRAGRRPLLHQV